MTERQLPGDSGNGEAPAPPPSLAKRAVKAATRQIAGFTSGVLVAVTAPAVAGVMQGWREPAPEIGIDLPEDRSPVKATPCVTVSGHGVPRPGTRLVVAVQQFYPENGLITFNPNVRVVGEEWQAAVPLTGPVDGWFRIRAVLVEGELAGYLGSVGGDAGASRWVSPSMPPGTAIAESVDVQRGPGQISC
ncbi:hypothetical protein [Sphaerisporangium sp. TRM90804]|uniref:hypothetical protein n=1 Tax=Sphaerisporangium sp. TRM90804 TaxID=3031113 RepID=UPI00244D70CE|nr:hypothetical protein [Sphaerisporangium sp. TRM90804]MDH2429052.1 hypothetical protein [Sphaerisporangium sp. TRM90804]